jgi:hypothetical protein
MDNSQNEAYKTGMLSLLTTLVDRKT